MRNITPYREAWPSSDAELLTFLEDQITIYLLCRNPTFLRMVFDPSFAIENGD